MMISHFSVDFDLLSLRVESFSGMDRKLIGNTLAYLLMELIKKPLWRDWVKQSTGYNRHRHISTCSLALNFCVFFSFAEALN